MLKDFRYVIGFVLLVVMTACSTGQLYYHKGEEAWKANQPAAENELLYSLYLVGDAGGDTTGSMPVMRGLKSNLKTEKPKRSGVVFLGDNIYPDGMHKKSSAYRAEDELRLNAQLDAVKEFKGDVVFIPGNHDWDHHGPGGFKHVKRQEEYIQKYLDRGNTFLPSHGCPGPEVVKLAPGLVMIIIDTQWWIHPFERPSGEKDGCDVRNPKELMVQFKDLLKKYRNQHVIVAGHHPLYSNGNHGGKFTLKDHLFPLTAKSKNAYIPLPVLGSIYPFYRKFLGHRQDIAHPLYNNMKYELVSAMNEYENVTYVAGHEHNLQYSQQRNVHHIVSGSGSKVTHLRYNGDIEFGARERGYARVKYYANGEIWLEFLINSGTVLGERLAYRKKLFQKDIVQLQEQENIKKVSYAGMFAEVCPDSNLDAGAVKRLFFGDLNRDIWATPLKVPYLDIHYDKGGLTPIKKGGGQQTLSLRMQGGDGKQYTLRGIKKNSMFLTASNLRGTIAQDIIYDGMAGSHPYASVVIPDLSDAAGVYHSNPTLVYVPKDSILGDYLEEFGGMFCLFEERPDGDMSDAPSFGGSKKVMNYHEAIAKMHGSHDHLVDVDYVLRARLFDMFLGDWDRHDDQWRWGSYKEKGKTWYRPIPRDRDQAFFEFDGVIMSIVNRKWLLRKFQAFDDDVRDISGLNFNARYFDRSFLIEADREDWIKQAEWLQEQFTDEVIEAAIKEFPREGYGLTGDEIIATLKERRSRLKEFAIRHYEKLALNVDIPGTLEDDFFDVKRRDDGTVEVSIYARKKGRKDKKHRSFHRVFHPDETKEIRLYGLEGNDEYHIKGKTKKSILVRVVSGFHNDRIEDKSKVAGMKKMTRIYETKGNNEYELGKESKLKTFKNEFAYDYDRKDFVNNKLAPLISVGYNPNDGFFIGPGFKYVAHGFKKSPYKHQHELLMNRTLLSNGYNLYYNYDFIDVIGRVDFAGKLSLRAPLVYQYFGPGNDSEIIGDDITIYNVRMHDYQFTPSFKWASRSGSQRLNVGANLRYVEFEDRPLVELNNWELGVQRFAGASLQYTYVNQDHKLNPWRGMQFHAGADWNQSVTTSDVSYLQLRSELRMYFPLRVGKKQGTMAIRSGIETNFGDYAFFHANFLSGFRNFRGVLRNRYSGETASFNNADIRVSLFKVPNYIVPFDVGLLGHYDLARVWQPGEDSDRWHESFGGGAYLNILDSFILLGTYSISEDDQLLTIGTKFLF